MVHKSTSSFSGSGSGSVTEVDTGTGLTGGPITDTGTISIADSTANTLAGFDNSGVFSDVTIGTNLTLSGGVLNASGGGGGGSPGGSTGDIQYNAGGGNFGGVTLVPLANGGTGADFSGQGGQYELVTQPVNGGPFQTAQIDLSYLQDIQLDITNHNLFVGQPPGGLVLGTAKRNTGFNESAFQSLTTGTDNTLFGRSALLAVSDGYNNTAFGSQALTNMTGSNTDNTALGFQAASSGCGNYNICIGSQSYHSSNSVDNEIVIAPNTQGMGANTVQIGSNVSPLSTDVYFGDSTAVLHAAGTSLTGTAPALTAGTVTTNANLTGPITSVGNATSIASSIALPGNPTTTTQSQGTSNTTISTTAYVDTAVANAIAGVNPAVTVQVATAAILPNSPVYFNGVSGVGATITDGGIGATSHALVVDGYTPVLNDRILVKNEGSGGGLGAAKNGVYFVSTLGVAGVTPWVITRALDYDQPSDINNTGAIPVINGTANALTQWVINTKVTTVGTDAINYTEFSVNPTTLLSNSLTSANVFVGSGSNIATGVAVSGDLTAVNTGAFTVAKIAGTVVSGTTGSTNVVFSTSPTLVTPTLGVATATSVNKMAITAPASSSTLAVADGKTFTASNTITLTGTDGVSANISNLKIRTIGFSATGTLATGQQGAYVVFPVAGTITGWSIVANAGTATVKVWKIAAGTTAPAIGNNINTNGVSLSTGTMIQSTDVTDFTSTTVTAGDTFAFNLSAVATATILDFQLQITVT